ncbi:hypothetical protein MKQ68_07800 [Chitinophaga horti]|uniref:Uncharacterized protein n=1 Tax=Chitinophaga horti TaxID=2920382 RepID=A0ABY6J6J6_9BACT|nr:hypothetical protein [Chitinophaga horti]UYQ94996.1 hypothetical protein MKQ68_07800 [Chitinophaga horti]
MKYLFCFLFLFYTANTFGQISFPKGFKLIAGDNLTGEDDRYSNGKYVFATYPLFRPFEDDIWKDDQFKKHVADYFGFPFYQTRDSLLWGTGKKGDVYSYVIVDKGGQGFELYSRYNDADFAHHSKWLLNTMREYRKKGKLFIFPMRVPKE